MVQPNARTARLNEWFPQCEWFPLLYVTDREMIDLRARVVYSYIVYRDRVGARATSAQIARATGIHRTKTLPQVLTTLRGLRLITERNQVIPLDEATSQLLHPRKHSQAKHWSDAFAYLRHYQIAQTSTLSFSHNVLLWTLFHFSPDGLVCRKSRRHIANVVGISEATVYRGIRKLTDTGFLKVSEDGETILFIRPSADQLRNFATKIIPYADIAEHRRANVPTFTLTDDDRYRAVTDIMGRSQFSPLEAKLLGLMDEDFFEVDHMPYFVDVLNATRNKVAFFKTYIQSRTEHDRGEDGHPDHSNYLRYLIERRYKSRYNKKTRNDSHDHQDSGQPLDDRY